MAEFHIRVWAEQTLIASSDYIVTADTLEQAAKLLRDVQDDADHSGGPVEHAAVRSAEPYASFDDVSPLDPHEVAGSVTGLTLIDGEGKRVRDLLGVPSGCEKMGDQLEIDWT